MFSFAFIFGSLVLATFIPVYLALYLVPALGVRVRYLAALAVGLTFWFFFDTMGDAGSLGENNSVYPPYAFGGLPHFALIGAFVAGFVVLAAFDQRAVPGSGAKPGRNALFLIPAVVALVMGVHSLGEGWGAVSAVASAPVTTSDLQALIQAFGTLPAIASYPFHKLLEATIVAALYTIYVKGSEGKPRWWEVPLLGVLFAGPAAIGAAFGYFYSLDTTYFFAFGVTAAFYAMLRLIEPLAVPESAARAPAHYGPKVVILMAVGMLLLYGAALLH